MKGEVNWVGSANSSEKRRGEERGSCCHHDNKKVNLVSPFNYFSWQKDIILNGLEIAYRVISSFLLA